METLAPLDDGGDETAPLPTSSKVGTAERRRRRSEDVITALHYQLAVVRSEAALDALVLVDDRGCLIAGAGAWPVCEELAAYAPFLARRTDTSSRRVSARVDSLAREVESLIVEIDGSEALLCGRGGSVLRHGLLARAAAGCKRILSS